MSQLFILLRAMLSEGMTLFAFKSKATSSRLTKILIPLLCGAAIMFSVGTLAFSLIHLLAPTGMSFIILTLAIIVTSLFAFLEAIYKSPSMLFECRDNNLILALPVSRRNILAARLLKLTIFQFLYSLLFILPIMVAYAAAEQPSFSFYPVSLLTLFLVPLIPTALGTLIGYLIKDLSSHFPAKRAAQTLFSILAMTVIILASFKMNDLLDSIVANATSINDFIIKFYYPAGAYLELVQQFSLLTFLKFLAVNILPFVALVIVGSLRYFKILSRTSEGVSVSRRHSEKEVKISVHSPLRALISKELNRYFSSSVYVMNTFVSVIMLAIATVALIIGGPDVLNSLSATEEMALPLADLTVALPVIYLQLIVFISCMTSITSSSISIEGKSFNLTKSLPIPPRRLLAAKILASNLIISPLMFICALGFNIRFTPEPAIALVILLATLIVPCFSALLGLIFNLKFPKLNGETDAEVVKQSTSSLLGVFGGMLVAALTLTPTIAGCIFGAPLLAVTIQLGVFAALDIVLWSVLQSYGARRLRELSA